MPPMIFNIILIYTANPQKANKKSAKLGFF